MDIRYAYDELEVEKGADGLESFVFCGKEFSCLLEALAYAGDRGFKLAGEINGKIILIQEY